MDAKDAKEDVEKKSIEQLVYILFIGKCEPLNAQGTHNGIFIKLK